MTNFERIKNMSVEKMAKLIDDVAVCCFQNANCENCPIYCSGAKGYCNISIISKWLKSEVEE